MSLYLSHLLLFLMSLSLSLQGVFLVTTKIPIVPVNRVYSVNTEYIIMAHEELNEVSAQASELSE